MFPLFRGYLVALLGLVGAILSGTAHCIATANEVNHVWQRVHRARRACQSAKDSCSERFRNLDPVNCVNYCLSTPCFEKIYGSEPLEEGEVDYKRARDFSRCHFDEKLEERRRSRRRHVHRPHTEL